MIEGIKMDMNENGILDLIEENVNKIKTSHSPLKKASYIAVVEKLCEAYQEQLNVELISSKEEKSSIKKTMTKEQYNDFFKNAGILPNQEFLDKEQHKHQEDKA